MAAALTGDPSAELDRDRDVLECAAAICPAAHRHNGQPTEPPCGNCYATAETVVEAWLARHPEVRP